MHLATLWAEKELLENRQGIPPPSLLRKLLIITFLLNSTEESLPFTSSGCLLGIMNSKEILCYLYWVICFSYSLPISSCLLPVHHLWTQMHLTMYLASPTEQTNQSSPPSCQTLQSCWLDSCPLAYFLTMTTIKTTLATSPERSHISEPEHTVYLQLPEYHLIHRAILGNWT